MRPRSLSDRRADSTPEPCRHSFDDDPTDLTPDERLCELVSILAEGFRRMRRRPALIAPRDQNAPQPPNNSDLGTEISRESRPDCLELSAASRPDGVVG